MKTINNDKDVNLNKIKQSYIIWIITMILLGLFMVVIGYISGKKEEWLGCIAGFTATIICSVYIAMFCILCKIKIIEINLSLHNQEQNKNSFDDGN